MQAQLVLTLSSCAERSLATVLRLRKTGSVAGPSDYERVRLSESTTHNIAACATSVVELAYKDNPFADTKQISE